MALKFGQRVTVKPGVSNCKNEGSLQLSRIKYRGDKECEEQGRDRSHFVGTKGEIVQVGADGPCTCPKGYESAFLVDSQVVNGKPHGNPEVLDMREWFLESEIEPG